MSLKDSNGESLKIKNEIRFLNIKVKVKVKKCTY